MDARTVESGLDEVFPDASELTPEQAKALGVVRGMLIEREEAECAAVRRFLTGITA